LKQISKLPIFVQKYLINFLATLYFPFKQKLENKTYFFEIKLFFQEFQNECQPFIFFISRKHDEKFEPSDPYIFVKSPLPYIFYFIFSRFLRFFPTRPSTWNTLILRHSVSRFKINENCIMHISILTRYKRGGRMFKNWLKRITITAHYLNKKISSRTPV
jgi:hypothetical protein